MNATQQDWMDRMEANLRMLREQFHGASKFDLKLKADTSRKIQEAVRRLKLTVISEKENAAANDFFDGEADAHVEWLMECLRIIRIYTAEPDEPEPDFERLYELEQDRRYHQFHGNVPLWAQ